MYYWTLVLIAVLCFMLLFLKKVANGLDYEPKKYYFLSITSVCFWLLFNFLYVNASQKPLALLFYSFMQISISLSAGFFFLTCISFVKKVRLSHCFLFSLPLFLSVAEIPFYEVVLTGYGYQAVYFTHVRIWMIVSLLVLLYGAFVLRKVLERVTRTDLRLKLKVVMISAVLAGFSAVTATVFSSFFNIPSFASLFTGLSLLIAYPAFST